MLENNEGYRRETKYVGVVELSDPTEVAAKVTTMGDVYSNGAVFCSCPEVGMEGANLIYCRYALSIPWYKVKDGDRLWIEPTIGATERWIYSGFVDCGRDAVAPGSTDQMILLNETGIMTITLGDMTIVLNSVAKTVDVNANGDGKAQIFLDATTPKIEITNDGNTIVMAGSTVLINGNLEVTA